MKQSKVYYLRLVLACVLGVLFIAASMMKLLGTKMEVEVFQIVGIGMWFMYFVGVWELLAGVLTLIKKYRRIGLILIALACVGAGIAQVFAIKQDWVHTVVLALLAGWLAYKEGHIESSDTQKGAAV